MTTDKRDPGFQEADEDIELRDTPVDEAAIDAWLFRNKDALNASMRKAEAEYARGETRSLDDVMAELLAKIRGKG